LTSSISSQYGSCGIARTRKLNYGIAPHTFWNGFAASALRGQSDGRIAENSAIAEAPRLRYEPTGVQPTCSDLVPWFKLTMCKLNMCKLTTISLPACHDPA
jgi:hypothetical protein